MGINFLQVKKTDGQYIIQLLKEYFEDDAVINHKYKVSYEDNYLFFPLVENKEIIDKLKKKIDSLILYKIISREPIDRPNFKYKSLQEALTGKIPDRYLRLIPNSYDIIGTIAILEFEKPSQIGDNEFNEYRALIADAVMNVNKNVQSVFEKKSEIKGEYRLREFSHLSGENTSETTHKENNCSFKLDIKNTYFSPRLVYERRRVSNANIQDNEVIVDMFAGVGPFSIQIAKLNPVKIHAFDVNPHAFNYLRANIGLNKLEGKIIPYNINAKDLLNPSNQIRKQLCGKVDRILMNLPEQSINFIDVACFLMKKTGGILHFYHFSEKPNPIDKTLEDFKKKLNEFNWVIVKISNAKIVKSFSPKSELVVIDLGINSLNS
ncbi:MAG: class I SAM-dependent methyltransferase [Promethearchaeota archaeon]